MKMGRATRAAAVLALFFGAACRFCAIARADDDKFFIKKFFLLEDSHGYVQSRGYAHLERTGPSEDVYQYRNDWRLEVPYRVADNVSGVISSQAKLHYGVNQDAFHPIDQSLKLREAYADFDRDPWSLRLGQQVIRWGKGDEINPTDDFTPEDFREFFNYERADRKLPIPAADLKYNVSDSTGLEGIWIPFFEQNRLADSNEDWKFFYPKYLEQRQYTFLPEEHPSKSLKNSTFAAKLTQHVSDVDFSLTYSYHFEEMPIYRLSTDPLYFFGLTPKAGTVRTQFDREHTLGGDFETIWGDYGVRGEAAFVQGKPHVTLNSGDADAVVKRNTIYAIVGADRSFKNNWYANLQLYQIFIPDRTPGMVERSYAANAVFRISKSYLHDKLKFQLSGIAQLDHLDYYYKPELFYELKDDLVLNAGLYLFQGKRQGFWGQFAENDQIFVSTKYSY